MILPDIGGYWWIMADTVGCDLKNGNPLIFLESLDTPWQPRTLLMMSWYSGSSGYSNGSCQGANQRLDRMLYQATTGQTFSSYDLNVQRSPDWIFRNAVADVIYNRGPDADCRVFTEIFNYETKLGGKTVSI